MPVHFPMVIPTEIPFLHTSEQVLFLAIQKNVYLLSNVT